MDKNTKAFLEKAKVSAEILAERTSAAATRAANAASKTATNMVGNTKLNLQILDLTTEIEMLYKEIGKLVYQVHTGEEGDHDELQTRLELIDEKQQKIAILREQLETNKSENICPNCGNACDEEDAFCKKCGAQL